MHHIKRVRPLVSLRPTNIWTSEATVTKPGFHKPGIIVKYFTIILRTCKEEVCDIVMGGLTRDN